MPELVLNYQNKLQIDITPEASATWVDLCEGFANVSENINEVLHQTSYLCDEGWGSTEVVGGQWVLTLTGDRKVGDPAQDFIFGRDVQFKFGKNRKTKFRVAAKDGQFFEWDVALAGIEQSGGDAAGAVAITVEIHGNGPPRTYVPDSEQPLEKLTIVSVPGTSGNSKLYINPMKELDSYKYQLGSSVTLPYVDDVLSAGWTSWDGTVEITATTGQMICIVEVDGSDKAKKGGIAAVISND